MYNYRRASQAVLLILFTVSLYVTGLSEIVRTFFKINPVMIGVAFVSAHFWSLSLAFALALLVLTLVMGRVFCGWACPLGTILDGMDFLFGLPVRAIKLNALKHHLLILLLCLAIGGFSLAWIMDPLNWASRISGFFILGKTEALWVFVLSGLFIAIEIAFGRRGFCRILCPLGAFLSWVSRISLYQFNIDDACNSCGQCALLCRMAAIDKTPQDFDRSACIHCYECTEKCPTESISFRYLRPEVPKAPVLPRRAFVFSIAGGVALAFGLRSQRSRFLKYHPILRPPGTVRDEKLRNLCIRCGSCARVCPTHGIVSDVGDQRPLWLQTPILSGRDGGCAYDCNACGKACPTGAIRSLSLNEKQKLKIGQADILEDRCIAYQKKSPCLVCYAACPVDAILLEETEIVLPWNSILMMPILIDEKCIGCGLCEAACPVHGKGAIRTIPRG